MWFRFLPACLALLAVFPASRNVAAPPNVVIVMTDDQGYGDLSCHGNPILRTPEMDRLYADSVRLTDYHVSPTCSPTRAALMTGHWSNRTGVWHTIMGRSMLRADEVTMGDVFRASGYATGMFGKWHLGDNYPYRPSDRGFDEVLRHGGGGVGQTPDRWDNAYFDGSYWHNRQPTAVKGFCTDVFFDYALQFMKTQHQADKPFLAYIATNAPHGPMHSPTRYSRPYKKLGVRVANFFGMIANIDENLAKLREFLDSEGLSENTIVIFTTDNGTSSGDHVFNAGMRGRKGSPYDGGHRVPMFIRWPAGDLVGGRDCSTLTAHVDVLPTLIELCALQPPESVRYDGRSVAPLLRGDRPADWPDRVLVTDSQRVKDPIQWRQSSVMTNRWRLVNRTQLFDIDADPAQQSNVIAQYPAVAERLRAAYRAWWSELQPSFANATPIHLGHPAENPSRLTSHDWITKSLTPWNQSHIRNALNGKANTGFWNVLAVADGTYEIALRRWPREVDYPIDASLPSGKPVSGQTAFRETAGVAVQARTATIKIGDIEATQLIEPGQREVKFEVELKAGASELDARFETATGETYGAYYVYVNRL